jgi:hypothetical protein
VQTFAENRDAGVGCQERVSQKLAEGGTHGGARAF